MQAIVIGVIIIIVIWLAYKWVTKNDKNKPTNVGGGTGGNTGGTGDVIE